MNLDEEAAKFVRDVGIKQAKRLLRQRIRDLRLERQDTLRELFNATQDSWELRFALNYLNDTLTYARYPLSLLYTDALTGEAVPATQVLSAVEWAQSAMIDVKHVIRELFPMSTSTMCLTGAHEECDSCECECECECHDDEESSQ